uniref:DOMON domain-containing protein n=1 Tax=Ascaris lumbricoides TaxID=6252 RepID=A0A0M3IMH9_ASCLU
MFYTIRRSDCGDPLVIANIDANISFSSNISWSCDCAVTIISLTEAADDLYTIAFTHLSTTSTTTSSDARRWQTFPILERIVTIVVPSGAIVNGSVSAAYLPLYDRRVRLGDMGIISSRNYPVLTSPSDPNVTYRLTATSPIPFVMDIVRAEIQSNAMLSMFTYPPIIIRKRQARYVFFVWLRIKTPELNSRHYRHRVSLEEITRFISNNTFLQFLSISWIPVMILTR